MAGLIDDFVQGYMSRMGGKGNNEALQAQNTASAYQRLQDVMKQDYDMQKKNFESDPSNKGQTWKMPSPTERMNDQVQAMILSGDQNLQARGLAMMDVPKETEETSLQKTASLLGLTPMQVFDKLHPGAASTRVNVNLPKQEQMVSIDDSQKIVMPDGSNPPVGATYDWVAKNGGRTVKTKDQSESDATAGVVNNALADMDKSNPGTTSAPIPGTIAEYRAQPGIVGQVLNTGLNVAGINQKPADVSFMARRNQVGMNITRLMSGAAASDQDVARVTSMLPQLSDDPATREIKFKAAREQAKSYIDAARAKGGSVSAPTAQKAPQATAPTKRFNPATGKIEAIK